jgi:hypothetical protein
MAVRVVPRSITEPYKKREGDFSPDLVGLQFTQGASLFTLGNFAITTNLSPSLAIDFNTGQFSQPYSLQDLNLSDTESNLLVSNTLFVTLNADPTNLERYVYFGSFNEFLRVNIEEILTTWKGSLYITDLVDNYGYTQIKNTVLSYSYNSYTNTSNFLIPPSLAINSFGLIIEDNEQPPTEYGDISNLSNSFDNYQISNDYGDFKVLDYTGTTSSNNYINVTVSGNSFPTLSATTFGSFKYHLRPTEEALEKFFFSQLDDFKSLILDRLVKPKYTITVNVPTRTDLGIVYSSERLTWPTTDGYNLDFEGGAYNQYITKFYQISNNYDLNKTDLVARRFVSESIIEFDTDGGGDELTGRKVHKLLRIYGREFDQVKKYIDGISFASHATYDKKDNISDELVKHFASTLGFDTILSFSDNNLLVNNLMENVETFTGYSKSLSIAEMDIELWRRLVINAWWLFKSKGHRKVIEFFLNLFGTNECVVNFDECVYLADNRLDYNKTIQEVANYIDPISGDTNLVDTETLPIDIYGFPRVLPNTPDYYFQNDGFWWNGGNLSSKGNNPHIGPYDYGKRYFDKFRCIIDGYVGAESATTVFTTLTNFFTDYNEGTIEGGMIPFGTTYGDIIKLNNRISDNVVVYGAGASNLVSRGGNSSFRVNFKLESDSNTCLTCPTLDSLLYHDNGIIFSYQLVTSVELNELTQEQLNQYWDSGQQEIAIEASSFTEECCNEVGGYYLPAPGSTATNDCPKAEDLVLTYDGIILGVDKQACCTFEVTGVKDVVWDNETNQCRYRQSGIGDTPTDDPFQSTFRVGVEESTTDSFSAQDLFKLEPTDSESSAPPLPSPEFVCWWCPPIEEYCGCSDIINNLDDESLIIILSNLYGISVEPGDLTDEFKQKIINRCVKGGELQNRCIKTINGNIKIDPDCCRKRGGIYNEQNGVCLGSTTEPTVDCTRIDYTIDKENIVYNYNGTNINYVPVLNGADNSPMPRECCSKFIEFGIYWVDGLGCVLEQAPDPLTPPCESTDNINKRIINITLSTDPIFYRGYDVLFYGDPCDNNPIDKQCCEWYSNNVNEKYNWISINNSSRFACAIDLGGSSERFVDTYGNGC